VLRFSPQAWGKLLYFRDRGPTEIGGFGITPADDLLYVQDFLTVKQAVTAASVSFDDAAVADFVDGQIDAGRKPGQVLRVWSHTHPGRSPHPSGTDEATFQRVFGQCDHAVMFIMARGGETYARLCFNVGPGGSMLIPVRVDYSRAFAGSDFGAWEAEYQANIQEEAGLVGPSAGLAWDDWAVDGLAGGGNDDLPGAGAGLADSILAELVDMEPAERQQILDELGLSEQDINAGQIQEVLS
jgi:proteasome lid subunit RPN8/RPN11